MSSTSKRLCKFIDKGCRKGSNCTFSHERHSPAGASSSPSRDRGNHSPRGTPHTSAAGQRGERAPRGNCDFYWSTGACARGFGCTFKHIQKPGGGASDPSATGASVHDERNILDFSTTEGLADINDIVQDSQHRLTPNEAHNAIKPYITNDYRFPSNNEPATMTGFARILASVDRRNRLWNSDHAQAFLEMIVQGNALGRIREVLQFQKVSAQSGMGFTVLSFQRGYFPVLQFFSSDLILRTTLHHNINALYTALNSSFENVCDIITICMEQMISARSWKDITPGLPPSRQSNLSGVVVFTTLSTLLLQFFLRFKKAIHNHPKIAPLVANLVAWFEAWNKAVSLEPPTFDDSMDRGVRALTVGQIRDGVLHLQEVVEREHNAVEAKKKPPKVETLSKADKAQALLTRLRQSYDPPGLLREGGIARHDNDAVNISDIRIIPTHNELLCASAPYLPINLAEAPHHCPPSSMQRHLDIQFRLLREDMIASIREAISVLQLDLDSIYGRPRNLKKFQPTQLEQILAKNGGLYRTTGHNSVIFHVYTGVEFSPLKAEAKGFTVGLILDSPPGDARNQTKARQDFWKRTGSKRLTSGSLVALLLMRNRSLKIYLGCIASSNTELVDSSKVYENQVDVRVKFFDPEVELSALRRDQATVDSSTFGILIDNNIMFESVRPFLDTLQTVEPTSIPFSRYISRSDGLNAIELLPPKYATSPSFMFKLDCLAKSGEYIHSLDVRDPLSVRRARIQLKSSSILDESQCDAMVDTLTREVALIQGPPGTGKSFSGKEILRVLFANNIKPVVLIAFTNHALDHMLLSILEAQITTNFVRIGSRSTDLRISEYTLDKLEKIAPEKSSLSRSVGREFHNMKKLEEQMVEILDSIQIPEMTWKKLEEYLGDFHRDQLASFVEPPFWIQTLFKQMHSSGNGDDIDEADIGGWQTVTHKKNRRGNRLIADTIYGFWKDAWDIDFIRPPVQINQNEEQITAYNVRMGSFFGGLGFGDQRPNIPTSHRKTSDLHSVANVWSLSPQERLALAQVWENDIRSIAYNASLEEYNSVRMEYEEACRRYNNVKDERRRRLLSSVDLIGCTTNGAAKLTSLMTTVAPKALMVEEAGQVLEAHIIASLVPSVQHLICIGDPRQLRPTLASYNLSMDSERGRELYKFDRSLMERLSDSGLPMSQINVQRRMRPSISTHIRSILYPKLEDHDNVLRYPAVQGMQKDVFFFTHTHQESGGEESSVSKSNMFEVSMIVDLVMYFLKQEAYSAPGDIAVLCAYLGQLQKVKAALRNLKVTVSLDERDEEQLLRQGMEDNTVVEQVDVVKHVRLGTVDIFQGEEAKIVIVSLVRNSGSFEGAGAPIGFLKSVNRINVALSRAKHGLYILGNASNLRQSETWQRIIDGMEALGQIGYGFPIVCPRHPEQVQLISKAGELPVKAPEGGCLLSCNYRMDCGHNCPSVCHSDLDKHKSMRCPLPCLRTPCPRSHPCPLICSDTCGPCKFPMHDVKLPCGHTADVVPCHEYDDLRTVKCQEKVEKLLPQCEHSATMACSFLPENFKCKKTCGGILGCCGKNCRAFCSDCLAETRKGTAGDVVRFIRIERSAHKDHYCERTLYCQHLCGAKCSQPEEHVCTTFCKQDCRQQCSHHQCKKRCGEDCAPCMAPCEWVCPHLACPVLCGSICARLPCDVACPQTLKCGHRCPSVCGEDCLKQKCVICLPEEGKQVVVDFLLQRSLAEIDLESEEISERLITLDCGHLFTVETLDGHCQMSEYYEADHFGRYLRMRSPPIDYQKPPTCPQCRNPITTRRYGRVTKRANLDILEQNVASNMRKSLNDVNPAIRILSGRIPNLEEDAKKLQHDSSEPSSTPLDDIKQRREEKFGTDKEVLAHDLFTTNAMTQYHGIQASEAKAWFELTSNFHAVYKKLARVASTRSAHVRAYEAALSTLYYLELSELASGEATGTLPPETQAMHNVNKKIGQPPPKADCRYHLEAFLLSVELRFMLGQLVRSRVDGLPLTSNDETVIKHRNIWVSFAEFIYQSCEKDCRKAIKIADMSSSSRMAARSSALLMCSEFERFRFEIIQQRTECFRQGKAAEEGWQDDLTNEIRSAHDAIEVGLKRAEQTYLRSRPMKTSIQIREERLWFRDNCRNKVERCLEEMKALEQHVRQGTVYQAVSLQEMEEIVKAFDFSHRGHFYNCPNGHPFVITECGGAMQASTCPECGAPIGGSNHNLDSSNTRAREFEEIASRQGSQSSPWAWAAGA